MRYFAPFILCFFLSCAQKPKQGESTTQAETRVPASVNKKLAKFLKTKPLHIEASSELFTRITKRLGPPQYQEFALENFSEFSTNKDPIYVLFYDGFELRVTSQSPISNEYRLKSIIIHDNVFPLAYNIKIGTSTKELRKTLGENANYFEEEQKISYCKSPLAECVHFLIEEDQVSKIIFDN